MDCWKWSTMFRRNLEWKQWPEENVEKLVWNNEEISWNSRGRSGREHTNCEGLWSSVPGCFSPVLLFVSPWTMHEYWSGWPFLSLGDPPHPGIKPGSPALQAESWLSSEPPGTTVLKCRMVRGWRCKDCRRGGLERCSQLLHSPSLSSFILLWESFLSSVEVLAFVAGSFLSGKLL